MPIPEVMIILVWRMFGIPNGGLTDNSLSFALYSKSTRWILGRVSGGYQRSSSWHSRRNWQEACLIIRYIVRETVHGVLPVLRIGTVGLLHRLMSFGIVQNSPEHGILWQNRGCTLRPNNWKHGVLAAVVTSEVIVHEIRKLPCAPNAGGSINQLRAASLKVN